MILFDFNCEDCGIFEELVSKGTEEVTCECGKTAHRIISTPRVARYNDPAAAGEALKKRSFEHSVKEAKQNAERIAAQLGGVAKAQNRWNLRTTSKQKAK